MKPKIQVPLDRPHWYDKQLIPDVYESDQICDECHEKYMALAWKGKLWTTGYCFPCSEKMFSEGKEYENLQKQGDRKDAFNAHCPSKYQEFDRKLIPNQKAYSETIAWAYGSKGLLLIGDSGKGKTRSAWRLLERLVVLQSLPFESITELKFSHEVARFGKSETLSEWIKRLCTIKILFIDDLGKAVMTERMASELFYIFEERLSNNLPIIATMQIDPRKYSDKIATRSGKEMADAIMRRLGENSEMIYF